MIRIPALLIVVMAAWPGLAIAARFIGETPPTPVGTSIDGFKQVMGPAATEPEHAGDFVSPAAHANGPPSPPHPSTAPPPARQ